MRTFFPVFFLLVTAFSFCQKVTERQDAGILENHAKVDTALKKSQIVRIVFYNLENLYDPYDDTTKLDDEFTSKGMKRWTFSKFLVKLDHLAKTFIAIGGWEPPAMIGMCEVENRYVLNKMIYETPLKKYKYKFIHYESADARGIDVALLYRPDVFKVVFSRNISIQFPFDSFLHTRDILYVKGVLFSTDTVHIFVNHWPSRRGGFTESVPKRRLVAQTLRSALDSLQQNRVDPKIIIMGDFNDEPDQPAICEVLKAEVYSTQTTPASLVNLMLPKMNNGNEGTYKFQGKWAILDQFMVSGNFLLKEKGLQTSPGSVHIFHAAFLMEEDERFLGGKMARTYSGPRYTGGFSDHLPVYLDVWNSDR
jgi:endonuclease/exonuclease/phosphatase family metal-dependent hydrolase